MVMSYGTGDDPRCAYCGVVIRSTSTHGPRPRYVDYVVTFDCPPAPQGNLPPPRPPRQGPSFTQRLLDHMDKNPPPSKHKRGSRRMRKHQHR